MLYLLSLVESIYNKVWPTNPSGKHSDFYTNLRRTLVLKLAKNASFMLFLVSDRTNGQFWLCSTSLHNPCSLAVNYWTYAMVQVLCMGKLGV